MTDEAKTSDLMARLFEIRRERAELENRDKELREEFDATKLVLMARADEQGATRIATSDGTAILTEEIVPNIADWDEFYGYIKENDAFHLLQRRVSAGAYREIINNGGEVPGLTPFKKRDVNLRAAK